VSPAQVITALRALGGRIWADGNRIHARIPRGALTPELDEAIRSQKDAVLALLCEERPPYRSRPETQARSTDRAPAARSHSPSERCLDCGSLGPMLIEIAASDGGTFWWCGDCYRGLLLWGPA